VRQPTRQTIQETVTRSERETRKIAGILWEKVAFLSSNKDSFFYQSIRGALVIALRGNLGAGKTVFAQGLLAKAGARGPFNSPTFIIMKKYTLASGDRQQAISQERRFDAIYHFDCYRINENDLKELDWKETLTRENNLVLVEWPTRIKKMLPSQYLEVALKMTSSLPQQREIQMRWIGAHK